MIIATSGHVDHGKTSLVQALTGINTDSLKQEKIRGLTIDLGFAGMRRGDKTIGFVDVPGHVRFINNMLAGVSGIDFGLLVIAADDGPMPQTEEHLTILALLGVQAGCIVITKIDRVGSDRLLRLNREIDALTANTPFANRPRLAVSSTSLAGLPALSEFLWRAAENLPTRCTRGFFRMAIDRVFSVKGRGLVVTGSIRSGKINQGDVLILHPQGIKAKVRGIQIQSHTVASASMGARCAINISGDISRDTISRGNWLADNANLPLTRVVDVMCHVTRQNFKPIKHWTPIHIHAAAQHVTGRLATLEAGHIDAGQTQLAQLVLDEAINVCSGDKLIIRDQAAAYTLGGCTVLNPFASRRFRNKPENLLLLSAIDRSAPSQRINKMLQARAGGLLLDQLSAMFNETINSRQAGVVHYQQYLFHGGHLAQSCRLILAALKTLDAPSNQTSLLKPCHIGRPIGQCALARLIAQGRLQLKDGLYQLPSLQLTLKQAEQLLWQKVESLLKENPLKPPVLHDLAKRVNLPVKTLEQHLSSCIRFKLVVRPIKNRFFLPGAIEWLKQTAINLAGAAAGGRFTVIEFRNKVGIGRNLCIELLEYFDSIGFTKRLGDQRIILNPEK